MKTIEELIKFIKEHLGSIEGPSRGETFPTWANEEDYCEEKMAKDIINFLNK